jgi:hypothetical protein
MKKNYSLVLILLLFCLVSLPQAQAMDSKVKVMLTTATYGTVSGALLGTAALAFGSNSRTIFQGASLGLYAGLIFGSYILWTHSANTKRFNNTEGQYPEDPDSPYADDGAQGSDGGTYQDGEYRWNPYQALEYKNQESPSIRGKMVPDKSELIFGVPLLLINF